jgi:hypothetical protein
VHSKAPEARAPEVKSTSTTAIAASRRFTPTTAACGPSSARRRRHHRFGRPIINFGLPYVYEPNYYADDECYVWQPATTPYGWRYMWMNICLDE